MNNYGYIYMTTNIIDGKIYVGKKKGVFNPYYFGSGLKLINAVNKYGKRNFIVKVITYAKNKCELNILEKRYIAEYKQVLNKDKFYNIAEGGDGGDTGVDNRGSNNGMFGKRGKDNLGYIERKNINCLNCGKEFEVRITSAQRFCCRKCVKGYSIWVYNNQLNKSIRVYKNELVNYTKNGWVKGRDRNFANKISTANSAEKNGMFGKGYLVSGEKNGMFGKKGEKHPFYGKHHSQELNEKNRLAHIGKVAWNKGLTKETDIRVLKYAQNRVKTLKGKKLYA